MIPMTMQYFLRRVLRAHATKTALVAGERSLTYAELDERSTRLAAALARAGLEPGDRLAILLGNSPEFFETEIAAAKAGLVKVPINTRLTAGEIVTILADCAARGIILDAAFADGVLGARARLPGLAVWVAAGGAAGAPCVAYESLVGMAGGGFTPAEVVPGNVYSIRYSGGTTGTPKGIVHGQASYVAIALSVIRDYEVDRDERSLQVTHPAHGANFVWPGLMARGATLHLLPRFDAMRVLEMIERHRITRLAMVPTMWYALLDHPRARTTDFSSVRTFSYISAPMAVERLRQALALLGPRLLGIYTLSESAVISTVLPKEEHVLAGDPRQVARLASAGREADDVQLRIVDERGNDVAPGAIGEIILKSPGNMMGYWNRPDLTAETLRDGWVWTGDLARRDDDGYVFLVDRKHDKIVTGAFNVYPREVEEVLYAHPAVREAAVVGIPDALWGEAVTAFVALHAGAACTADALLAYCAERLADFKRPKAVHFVDDIPKTSVGKIARRALSDPYWADRQRRIG